MRIFLLDVDETLVVSNAIIGINDGRYHYNLNLIDHLKTSQASWPGQCQFILFTSYALHSAPQSPENERDYSPSRLRLINFLQDQGIVVSSVITPHDLVYGGAPGDYYHHVIRPVEQIVLDGVALHHNSAYKEACERENALSEILKVYRESHYSDPNDAPNLAFKALMYGFFIDHYVSTGGKINGIWLADDRSEYLDRIQRLHTQRRYRHALRCLHVVSNGQNATSVADYADWSDCLLINGSAAWRTVGVLTSLHPIPQEFQRISRQLVHLQLENVAGIATDLAIPVAEFSALRTLSLVNLPQLFKVYAVQPLFRQFFSPVIFALEELHIENCNGLKVLELSLPSLQRLILRQCASLSFEAMHEAVQNASLRTVQLDGLARWRHSGFYEAYPMFLRVRHLDQFRPRAVSALRALLDVLNVGTIEGLHTTVVKFWNQYTTVLASWLYRSRAALELSNHNQRKHAVSIFLRALMLDSTALCYAAADLEASLGLLSQIFRSNADVEAAAIFLQYVPVQDFKENGAHLSKIAELWLEQFHAEATQTVIEHFDANHKPLSRIARMPEKYVSLLTALKTLPLQSLSDAQLMRIWDSIRDCVAEERFSIELRTAALGVLAQLPLNRWQVPALAVIATYIYAQLTTMARQLDSASMPLYLAALRVLGILPVSQFVTHQVVTLWQRLSENAQSPKLDVRVEAQDMLDGFPYDSLAQDVAAELRNWLFEASQHTANAREHGNAFAGWAKLSMIALGNRTDVTNRAQLPAIQNLSILPAPIGFVPPAAALTYLDERRLIHNVAPAAPFPAEQCANGALYGQILDWIEADFDGRALKGFAVLAEFSAPLSDLDARAVFQRLSAYSHSVVSLPKAIAQLLILCPSLLDELFNIFVADLQAAAEKRRAFALEVLGGMAQKNPVMTAQHWLLLDSHFNVLLQNLIASSDAAEDKTNVRALELLGEIFLPRAQARFNLESLTMQLIRVTLNLNIHLLCRQQAVRVLGTLVQLPAATQQQVCDIWDHLARIVFHNDLPHVRSFGLGELEKFPFERLEAGNLWSVWVRLRDLYLSVTQTPDKALRDIILNSLKQFTLKVATPNLELMTVLMKDCNTHPAADFVNHARYLLFKLKNANEQLFNQARTQSGRDPLNSHEARWMIHGPQEFSQDAGTQDAVLFTGGGAWVAGQNPDSMVFRVLRESFDFDKACVRFEEQVRRRMPRP